jgi:hypothetical protein
MSAKAMCRPDTAVGARNARIAVEGLHRALNVGIKTAEA